MKKLGYILASFPGITETFIGTEIRAIEKLGHQVELIILRDDTHQIQPADQLLYEKRRIIARVSKLKAIISLALLWRGVVPALKFILKQKSLPKLSLLLHGTKCALVCKSLGIQHVHAHFAQGQAAHAIVAAKLLNLPCSFTGHGHDIYAKPEDLALKLTNVTFAVSVCCELTTYFMQQCPSAVIATVFCGIDISRFTPIINAAPKRKLLFIGRVVEKKGIHTLIDALASMPPANRPELDIIGDGPMRTILEKKCMELSLESQVHFLGFKYAHWIIEHGHEYMALVAPCQLAENGDRDTGPIVVKEAMGLGIPVITTSFMGLKEIVTETSGYVALPDNVQSLSDAISRCVLATEDARLEVAQNGRQRLLQWFTDDIQALELAHWFEYHTPRTANITTKIFN